MSNETPKEWTLETEQVQARYDLESKLLRVVYHGVLNPAASAQLYRWLGQLLIDSPEEANQARGSIFDFWQVTRIDNSNLTSAQRQSQQMNERVDLTNHPVALIAANLYQRELLRLTMQISPQQDRKRIVSSEAEALEFIEHFHRTHIPT